MNCLRVAAALVIAAPPLGPPTLTEEVPTAERSVALGAPQTVKASLRLAI